MENKIVIAIDGYSGCGKSTTAKLVAKHLGYLYIDSGAMYRAVTLYFLENEIDYTNSENVLKALANIDIYFDYNPATNKNDTYLNGKNVESEIRKMYISDNVSNISKITEVRKAMVKFQKNIGNQKGVVMDGRDIGTQVFPDAELKIFMTADVFTRAQRRQAELLAKGENTPLQEIIENLQKRDHIDTTRTESPLRKAEDAFLLDSTYIDVEEQTNFVIRLAQQVTNELKTSSQFIQ